MPRFFRRLAEGVFDEADLLFRTHELYDFLQQAAEMYQFDRRHIVAIGYSNGANIAASMMFHIPHALKGAILHHPMVPRRGVTLPDLSGTPVFIGRAQGRALMFMCTGKLPAISLPPRKPRRRNNGISSML